ncbi:MAG TPA: hypothetical protein DCY42_07360 [Chloroflexi bacterium]|nr:hypothetical protein [Chloroflexota bacterium]
MDFENMDYDYDQEDDDVFNRPLDLEEVEEPGPGGGFQLSDLWSKLTTNPMYLGAAALVVGLIFGLIFAWGVWPVQYVDAAPEHLHENFQLDYMRMVIDSYNLRQDTALADRRIAALGESGSAVLEKLIANPGDEASRQAIQDFVLLYKISAGTTTGTDGETAVSTLPVPGQADAEQTSASGSSSRTLLILGCAVSGVLLVAFGVFYFLRQRNSQPGGKTAAARAQEFSNQAMQTDYEAMGEVSPIAQWMTTYLIGDDLFDDSFSIDSLSGEFLGECGVGIADTIGVGEPKRVSAFEVWLFDKNDIQTVTKVLMSGHAMNDEGSYARLEAKGEPVLAVPGGIVELETKTLRMAVRVMDMDYGTGHLPENSFFQRVTLELAIWSLGS